MKKLLTTMSLCVTVFSVLAAVAPRPAGATPSIPIPPPAAMDLQEMKLAEAPKPLFLPRAELDAHIYLKKTAIPGLVGVVCVVRNIGLLNSGPFQTLLSKVYVGTPALPGPAVAMAIAMNIPAGGYQVFSFIESAPVTIGLNADFTHAVPEYNEANNSFSMGIIP
jgi:hypothetical protein